jgi:hypothetical protein
MSDVPLLVAVDYQGTERFVIIIVDFGAGTIRSSSNPMSEEEAQHFFVAKGEAESIVSERLKSARDNKGKF